MTYFGWRPCDGCGATVPAPWGWLGAARCGKCGSGPVNPRPDEFLTETQQEEGESCS